MGRQAGQRLRRRVHRLQREVRRVAFEVAAREIDVDRAVLGIQDMQPTVMPHAVGPGAFERGGHGCRQVIGEVVGLGQVVVGAGLQRRQRDLLVPHAGEHHHGQRQRARADLQQQFHPAAVGQVQVGQHQRVALGRGQQLPRLCQRRRDVGLAGR